MSYEKINKAIESGLFSREMCEIVKPPSLDEISKFSSSTGIQLNNEHIDLLVKWGGSNLDEIRINGLEEVVYENTYTEFANDYNGFIYKYGIDGAVFVEDTDGGEITKLAPSISEFINNILLGEHGELFYGEEWVAELREYGIA